MRTRLAGPPGALRSSRSSRTKMGRSLLPIRVSFSWVIARRASSRVWNSTILKDKVNTRQRRRERKRGIPASLRATVFIEEDARVNGLAYLAEMILQVLPADAPGQVAHIHTVRDLLGGDRRALVARQIKTQSNRSQLTLCNWFQLTNISTDELVLQREAGLAIVTTSGAYDCTKNYAQTARSGIWRQIFFFFNFHPKE